MIKMPKKAECVKFKNFERKIKSAIMIYADFENNLAPKDNGKQNPEKSYTNNYQKQKYQKYIKSILLALMATK